MDIWAYIPLPAPLVKWDRVVFKLINGTLATPPADVIFPLLRNPFFWAPLYLFTVCFVIINYKKKGLQWFILALATAATTDFVGNRFFKQVFERLRPCADPAFAPHVRMVLGRCSGAYSFVSNHAINHFGIAAFFYFTFRHRFRYAWLVWVWAGLIGYAQVYVGVHYPADVIAGSLLGSFAGWLISRFFNKKYGFTIFGNETLLTH